MAERFNEAYMLVSNEEYDDLTADSDFLHRLYALGVDNWVGYGEAFRDEED